MRQILVNCKQILTPGTKKVYLKTPALGLFGVSGIEFGG